MVTILCKDIPCVLSTVNSSYQILFKFYIHVSYDEDTLPGFKMAVIFWRDFLCAHCDKFGLGRGYIVFSCISFSEILQQLLPFTSEITPTTHINSSCLFVAELNSYSLTVGKIYAGLLIAENWRAYQASQELNGSMRMVRKQRCALLSVNTS